MASLTAVGSRNEAGINEDDDGSSGGVVGVGGRVRVRERVIIAMIDWRRGGVFSEI